MKNIKKVFVDGEEIFLKNVKYLGWGVVYPMRNEDGTLNWFNIITGGTWAKLIITSVMVIIILGLANEYVSTIERFMNCFENVITLENCKVAYGQGNFIDINNLNLSIKE